MSERMDDMDEEEFEPTAGAEALQNTLMAIGANITSLSEDPRQHDSLMTYLFLLRTCVETILEMYEGEARQGLIDALTDGRDEWF